MSASGGMSQLLKGIFIGVVLIMAIIGTMSILDSDNPLSSFITKESPQGSILKNGKINAPSITLNPDEPQNTSNNNDSSNIGDLNANIEDEEDDVNNAVSIVDTNNIPVLEGERSPEQTKTPEQETPAITYGMMDLNSVNSNNGQKLKANYIITDKNNVKVAESKNVSNISYRLPSGQYKVETTLTRLDTATNQTIPILTKSRYLIIRKNATTNQTFELEPPAITGVLQVSAKMNKQVIRANFVVQKENGEIIATRNNVSNSLFKLDSGSYKVSVSNGTNKDFRSVEVKPGESTQTVFILKEATKQGKLLIRVFDTKSNSPMRADITISTIEGTEVENVKAITQTELTLAAGDYKISVVGPNGKSNKNIRISSSQTLSETFRFDAPETNIVSIDNENNNNNNKTQINETVTIKPVDPQTAIPNTNTIEDNSNSVDANTSNDTVSLRINIRDELTRRPIKSNIYIQTLSGTHLDKKTYVDNGSFTLEPGDYKVTVRTKNRKNNVKTIRLSDNNITETFVMTKPNDSNNQVINTTNNQQPTTSKPAVPIKPVNTTKVIETGFLNVAMRATNNQSAQRPNLNTHFIVTRTNGQKIVELTSVPAGNFKLDVGNYFVTAIYNSKRQRRRVDVRPNQNTRLNFNTGDFLEAKGILRSSIVNEFGKPLRGNLIVRNIAGQIVARASNTSSATFNLPPIRHNISVNFEGLTGSEIVNISTNETTVQTFTIASNNQNRSNNNPRDIKEILKEKIEKEIRRTF